MKTTEQKGSSYHLLIEDLRFNPESKAPNPKSSEAAGGFSGIEIPAGGGLVAVNDGRQPQIVKTLCYGKDNTFVFQPFWNRPDSHLLMVCPGLSRPLINATPAPAITLLTVKDEIIFPNAPEGVAHVSIYNRPLLGPPPVNLIGRKCPICRSKLSEKTVIYTCYQCGQVIHYKSRENSDSGTLNCANVCRNCPVCRAEIFLTDGYVYLPEPLQKRG